MAQKHNTVVRPTSMGLALMQAAMRQGEKPATIGHYIGWKGNNSSVGVIVEPSVTVHSEFNDRKNGLIQH